MRMISYYHSNDNIFCGVVVVASKRENLQFIIGSKKLNLAQQKKIKYREVNVGFGDPMEKSKLKSVGIEAIIRPDETYVYLLDGINKELLNDKFPHFYYGLQKVLLLDDLDGDGKKDYILHYGDKLGVVVLYLSHLRKPGKKLQRVSMYFASYCC